MKKGFTFIEMLFVIVIMGMLAKFGSEIFRNVYQNYTSSTANNKMQIDTELVLQQIANRLQFRLKDSVIATRVNGNFTGLSSITDSNYTAFEWIGYDIDGFLGNNRAGVETYNKPTWTGFIDVDAINNPLLADTNTLFSPSSDTGEINIVINALSPAGVGIADSAIFFVGENANVQTDYGWNTGAQLVTQNNIAAHRIQAGGTVQQFDDITGADFNGTDIYEQYRLSWTAYALEVTNDGNLTLHYDYRPWDGENYDDANTSTALLMENVSTAKLQMLGDMINIQICVDENNITRNEYSVCKEKTIF